MIFYDVHLRRNQRVEVANKKCDSFIFLGRNDQILSRQHEYVLGYIIHLNSSVRQSRIRIYSSCVNYLCHLSLSGLHSLKESRNSVRESVHFCSVKKEMDFCHEHPLHWCSISRIDTVYIWEL